MKEGVGDILYLLAMAGFFIFSSIMKSRKAKKNLPPQPAPKEFDPWEDEEEESLPNFEEIFKTEPTPKVPEPMPIPVVADTRVDLVKERERITEQLFAKQKPIETIERAQVADVHSDSYLESSDSYNTQENSSYWDYEEFDLKKAVVFSEILNRPEI